MTLSSIYLGALAYSLGQSRPVSELPLDDDLRVRLLGPNGGLCRHLISDVDTVELASRSASASLGFAEEVGIGRDQIDALMVASNSIRADHWMDGMRRLVEKLKIGQAEIVLISSGDCCNFHVGLRHCYAMVYSGQYRNVLFVTADRVDDSSQGQHIATRGAGVNSDAAASALISNQIYNGFRLFGHFEQIRDAHLLSEVGSDDDFVKVLSLARRVAKGLCAHHGWHPTDFAKLITSTYTLAVTELLSMSAQLPPEAIFAANIARTGHCFAADTIINLLDFTVQEEPPAGSKVMLLGSGVHQWGATAVEVGEESIGRIR